MRYRDFDDMLKNKAESLPDHAALRYGEKTWTFRELYEAVCRKAEEYRASGKTCLGILADGSPDCVISLFGAAKAGLQLVMLDAALPDEAYPPLLAYTDVDILWGDPDLTEELAPHLGKGVRSIPSARVPGTAAASCLFPRMTRFFASCRSGTSSASSADSSGGFPAAPPSRSDGGRAIMRMTACITGRPQFPSCRFSSASC